MSLPSPLSTKWITGFFCLNFLFFFLPNFLIRGSKNFSFNCVKRIDDPNATTAVTAAVAPAATRGAIGGKSTGPTPGIFTCGFTAGKFLIG